MQRNVGNEKRGVSFVREMAMLPKFINEKGEKRGGVTTPDRTIRMIGGDSTLVCAIFLFFGGCSGAATKSYCIKDLAALLVGSSICFLGSHTVSVMLSLVGRQSLPNTGPATRGSVRVLTRSTNSSPLSVSACFYNFILISTLQS